MKAPHYTEIKVKRRWLLPRVTVGFLFDLYAWNLLYMESGIQLQDTDKLDTGQLVTKMLYNGAVSYFKDQGKKIWFKESDVSLWLDELKRKDFDKINKVFLMSFQEITKKTEALKGEKKK